MIVGFSRHGQGSARPAINYFTSKQNPDGTERHPAPEVLRGDPELIGQLIEALPFKHTYTSGVLSFAPGEVITPEMEERIMDEFERIAFAGLDRDQYAILWVRHAHAGHEELNFLVARTELSTGKSLNIAPPGKASRELFDTFRSWVNSTWGLADPDDPERSQDVSLPHHLAKLRAASTRKGEAYKEDIREVITAYVRREVDAGRVKDRDGVVAFLKGQGFEIPRTGKEYITVIDAESGERIRLKGGLYNREKFDPGQEAGTIRYGVPDPERAAELREKLDRLAASRARYNRQRYRSQTQGPSQDLTPGENEKLDDYLHRQLGEEAITPRNDGGLPARSTQRRRHRQRMRQSVEEIEREIVEGRGRDRGSQGRDISTMNLWLDPDWWDDFYGEDINP
jgi:hypothetical protein